MLGGLWSGSGKLGRLRAATAAQVKPLPYPPAWLPIRGAPVSRPCHPALCRRSPPSPAARRGLLFLSAAPSAAGMELLPGGARRALLITAVFKVSQVAECSGTNGPGGRKRPPVPPDLAGTDREGSPPPTLAWSWGRGERDGSVGLRPDLGTQLWVSDKG